MGLLKPNPGPGAPFLATGRIVHDDALVAVAGDEVSLSTAIALGLVDDDTDLTATGGEEGGQHAALTPGPAGDVTTAVTPNLADATVQDILAAVGDDPARALRVIEAEQKGRRRKTLLSALEKVAAETPRQEAVTEPDEPDPSVQATTEPDEPDPSEQAVTVTTEDEE